MSILTGELHKLVFGGKLAGTESWACSIHMATQGVETEPDAPALILMMPPIMDWFQRVDSRINTLASLDFAKLNRVDKVTGHYADPTDSVTFFPVPVGVPSGMGTTAPPQLTAALTWHSDIIRGHASKGRIYPPTTLVINTASQIDSTGRLAAANALQIANSAQELLSELNNATTNLTCVVWSQVAQVARAIEKVSCGRVIDTQRRRRANLLEEREFATANV